MLKVQEHDHQIQGVGSGLLKNHEALLEAQQVQKNVLAAQTVLTRAAETLQLCIQVNDQISLDQPYAAIKVCQYSFLVASYEKMLKVQTCCCWRFYW